MASLCVNIDHIATLRQARRGLEPDPLWAAGLIEMAGSTGITVHLREDQRHIQERDARLLREVVRGHLNLEMAATPAMVEKALQLRPDIATLVPERREEVTTEGGLDVAGQFPQVATATEKLRNAGIEVSLFIDPSLDQLAASRRAGAQQIEFHTGQYCNERSENNQLEELRKLYEAAAVACEQGLIVNAGHGLNYYNVLPVAAIEGMRELNIGHSIISRALFSGIEAAVREMAELIERASCNPQACRPAGL
jgi:pyridoxine 5-phosphate synthase